MVKTIFQLKTRSLVLLALLAVGCRTGRPPMDRADLPGLQPVPYEADEATALLLHLDGDLSAGAGLVTGIEREGGEWIAEGVIGGALACDGEQRVIVPPLPDLADGFTVEAWVRLEGLAAEDIPSGPFVMHHLARWGGVFEAGFEMRAGQLPRMRMAVTTDAGTFEMRSHSNFPCRRWVHVAWVYDPDPDLEHNLTMYIQGRPSGLRSRTTRAVAGRAVPTDEPLVLFADLTGAVDEVRISNRPRAPEEFQAPWLSGRQGDFEPFAPDVSAPPPPADWNPDHVWLAAAQAVPTYHAIGLYVPYLHDTDDQAVCRVRFRARGARAWRAGLDLVADRREREFRGSLLNLEADTLYEIELLPEDEGLDRAQARPLHLTARTWAEQVPIAEVRHLPPGTHQERLVIEARGRPDGWILYAPPEGEYVEYDAGGEHSAAVVIRDSSYVILRNITARGGTHHGVHILESHDVRLQRCEITGWGSPLVRDPQTGRYVIEGTPITMGGRDGVRIGRSSLRITVEDNLIHAPLGGANSWRFGHPAGTHAMLLGYNGSHHNVIRNNEMIGSEEHWWNDTIEGAGNQAVHGGPYRDTDVYGNVLAFANDNAFEFDGGQMNVRFWENRMEFCYRSISFSPCLTGPGYAFRNLVARQDSEHYMAGGAYKVGSIYTLEDVGWNLIFHNTVYGAGGAGLVNRTYEDGRRAFKARAANNLYASESAYVSAAAPQAHRLEQGFPVFVDPDGGDFRLAAGSPGIDAGVPLPMLNEEHAGAAPDLGLFEHRTETDGFFPRRHSGLHIRPLHANFVVYEDEERSQEQAVIQVTVPATAGRSWKAHPSSPWIEVQPAEGPAAAEPQSVTLRLRPRGALPGPLRGAVTFRTDEGYNATMTLSAEVRQREPFRLLLEAEEAEREGPWVVGEDPRASGGRYVYAPANTRRSHARITFTFEVPEDGEYYVLLRARAPSPVGSHNSFFVLLNGEQLTYSHHTPGFWKLTGIGTDWSWWLRGYDYNERRPYILDRDPRAMQLSAGRHTLTLSNRQAECRLDAILVTSQPLAGDLPMP